VKLQLNSIEQAPSRLPSWQAIMEDLAYPSARKVARVLGMSERSVYRFNRDGDAPKVASLALFWLTRWGRAAVHAQATNDAIAACGYAQALRDDVARLEARIAHLLALGNSGAANDALVRGPRG
jgi:predicted DNA-binding transcriptional regulator AlpA